MLIKINNRYLKSISTYYGKVETTSNKAEAKQFKNKDEAESVVGIAQVLLKTTLGISIES